MLDKCAGPLAVKGGSAVVKNRVPPNFGKLKDEKKEEGNRGKGKKGRRSLIQKPEK